MCLIGYLLQYMSMLIALIVTELLTATVLGIMTYRVLTGLEPRLAERMAEHYGHDETSDSSFTHSLDYAQYKVQLLAFSISRTN